MTLTFICLFKAIIANEKNKIAFNYITADLEIRRLTGQVKAVESREAGVIYSLYNHQNKCQEMGYDWDKWRDGKFVVAGHIKSH